MRPGPVACARTGRHDARQGGGAGCPFAIGGTAPQPDMTKPTPKDDASNRLVAVTLDEESIGRSGPDIEHERAIAIYDLIEENLFAPDGQDGNGPFALHIGITGNRLMFDIRREDATPGVAHLLSLGAVRRRVQGY